MKIRTLIVDDEPLARERVRTLLAKETDVEILAECGTGAEAVEAITEHRPDLVILDIQMPGMDGFEVLREVGPVLPAVIFVTAHDAFAVKAFEVHALDYVLKPFKPARLKAAIEQARVRLAAKAQSKSEKAPDAAGAFVESVSASTGTNASATERILALLEARRAQPAAQLSRIAVKTGDRVRFIRVQDVDWIEAAGNYVVIHAGGEKHIIRETLGALEAALSPAEFFRASRSAVVHLERVQETQPAFNGEHVIVLRGGTKIPMTRGLRELQERLRVL